MIRKWTEHVLVCDSCSKELPSAKSAVEARAHGYSVGWRFPAGAADGRRVIDRCPDCLAGLVADSPMEPE